jgi:RNA polymerase sigma-70 factor, ECF subfamily
MDQAFIELYYPRIHRTAWTLTGCASEAEDLAQETFIVALDRWDSFEGRSQRATWLIGILIRLKARRDRSLGRLRRRLVEYFQHTGFSVDVNPETIAVQQEWQQSVWAQVSRLPPPQRDVIVLKFAEQLTHDEIAEAVGCPVGTVKTRLHHAIKRLKQFPEMISLKAQRPHSSTLHSATMPWIESEACEIK